jgi:hypothetical protein
MNRLDFGELIRALRREHEAEDGAPWTQDRLAQEANLALGAETFTEDIVGAIERGKRSLDRQTLQALATALQLMNGERKEFFLAASGIANGSIARKGSDPKEILSQLTYRLQQVRLPGHIADSYCDVLAVNHTEMELLELDSAGLGQGTGQRTISPHNAVLFTFSDEGAEHLGRVMGDRWSSYAYMQMMVFRTWSLPYRSTDYFQNLLQELRKYKMFRRYWREVHYAGEDPFIKTGDVHLNSPKWGQLAFFASQHTALTSAGELHLTVFAPLSDRTAKVFSQISEGVDGPNVLSLEPSWPQKGTPATPSQQDYTDAAE